MNNACGYCFLHKEKMSFRQMKLKGCLDSKKQKGKVSCRHFRKFNDARIWFIIQNKKRRKKAFQMLKAQRIEKIILKAVS